jgi:hypothetical protein
LLAQTSTGRRLTGPLQNDPNNPARFRIGKEDSVDRSELVSITRIREDFWDRLDLGVGLGFSVTKANATKQLTLRAASSYRAANWLAELDLSILRSLLENTPSTRRSSLGGNFRRYLTDRWFGMGTVDLLKSDELQLDLRSTLGGGVGSYLIQNNRWYVSLVGGTAWTSESFQGDFPRANSGEAFSTLEFFAFDIGDLAIQSRWMVLPGLSEWGRVRMNLNTDVRWDLSKGLYFNLGFADNYDNRPTGEAPSNDYLFTTTVGWEY